MPDIGLVEACEDERLLAFGAFPRQRDLLSAIETHPLTVAACGRRSGKTRCAAAAALWNLLLVPELDALVGRDEPRYAISVANSQHQAGVFVQHARALVRSSPLLAGRLVADNRSELVFRGRGRSGPRVLAAFPATAAGIRGFAASFVSLDEFAHAFDVEGGGPAAQQRLFEALTPSVAQFGELGRVVVVSTPFGENTFSILFKKAASGEIAGASAFRASTREMNPGVSESYLTAQEAALGWDAFRSEYLAEFVAGGSSFFDAERIRVATAGWRELPASDGHDWVLALDPAFSGDATGLAVVGRDPWDLARLRVGYTARYLPPKRRRKGYRSREETDTHVGHVLDEVAAVAQRFGLARAFSDQHLPGVVVDELRRRGVAVAIVPWTPESRTRAFSAMRARIETERIDLPDDPQLGAELARVRSKLRAGSSTIELPKIGDSHCDVAVAACLGVFVFDRYGATSPTPEGPAPLREDDLAEGFRSVLTDVRRGGRLRRGMSL